MQQEDLRLYKREDRFQLRRGPATVDAERLSYGHCSRMESGRRKEAKRHEPGDLPFSRGSYAFGG